MRPGTTTSEPEIKMASSSTVGNKFSDTHFHWHVFVCDSWHNFETKGVPQKKKTLLFCIGNQRQAHAHFPQVSKKPYLEVVSKFGSRFLSVLCFRK